MKTDFTCLRIATSPGERYAAFEGKLNLISRTVHTLAELLHSKRSLRLEWWIVILIEIVLTLYSMATQAG